MDLTLIICVRDNYVHLLNYDIKCYAFLIVGIGNLWDSVNEEHFSAKAAY